MHTLVARLLHDSAQLSRADSRQSHASMHSSACSRGRSSPRSRQAPVRERLGSAHSQAHSVHDTAPSVHSSTHSRSRSVHSAVHSAARLPSSHHSAQLARTRPHASEAPQSRWQRSQASPAARHGHHGAVAAGAEPRTPADAGVLAVQQTIDSLLQQQLPPLPGGDTTAALSSPDSVRSLLSLMPGRQHTRL